MTAKMPRAPQQRGPRLFVEGLSSYAQGAFPCTFVLPESDSHYVRNVLRLRTGDPLEVGDKETGDVFQAHVAGLQGLVAVEISERISAPAPACREITLLFALCKGSKNDLVCDWATELGCARIIFWQAERSVVRIRDDAETAAKAERLAKIGQAAAQQSRQPRPPAVRVCRSLAAALEEVPQREVSLKLACSLSQDTQPIGKIVQASEAPIAVVIGPEGDLSSEEERLLKEAGFRLASLGPNVLRSELAVVAALVAVRL